MPAPSKSQFVRVVADIQNENGQATCAALAARLGLSRSQVGVFVERLAAAGRLVVRMGKPRRVTVADPPAPDGEPAGRGRCGDRQHAGRRRHPQ